MTASPRGRGRPTVFEPRTRDAYLTLLRHGVRLGDAADQLGISRATPNRARKADPAFAAAMGEALEVGAKVRREGVPHGEYRYNVLGCRCPVCTRAATVARASRRTNATPADEPPAETAGDVHPIRLERAVVGESPWLASLLLPFCWPGLLEGCRDGLARSRYLCRKSIGQRPWPVRLCDELHI